MLAGAVLRVSDAVAAGPALVGGEYAIFLVLERDGIDLAAPLVAAGLVLAAELGYAAVEPPLVRAGPGLALRRAARPAARTLAAGATALLVVAVASTEVRAGLAVELLGIAAAVAAVGCVALLAHRIAKHY